MKALIGISSFDHHSDGDSYVSVNSNYSYSITAAGGLAVVLPGLIGLSKSGNISGLASDYIGKLDGIVFSGGGDIHPHLFNETPIKELGRMSIDRDEWELALFRAAWDKGLPILAICRGCQIANVALGGNLYQDIPSQLPESGGHYSKCNMDEGVHYINISPSSMLHEALGQERVLVNSFHHQSIKNLGDGLMVSAKSDDGIIEAIEGSSRNSFLLGLQFHPEAMSRRYPEFLKLFRYFLKAC